jgi:hypothetical protein
MRCALVFLAGCSSLLDLEPPPVPIDAIATPSWTFHDDFELGDLQRWTQTTPNQSTNGSFEIATSGAHAGCCALHASLSPPGKGFQYALEQWTQAAPVAPPVTSGTIAVRAYVRAVALDPDTREFSFAEGAANPTAYTSAGLGRSDKDDGTAWGFILSDSSTANYPLQSADLVADAIGGWHCVEYDIAVADAGHLALYMDGAVQIAGDANTSAHIGWDSVTVGLDFSSGVAASEVYVDDVAIALYSDTSPTIHIGCE